MGRTYVLLCKRKRYRKIRLTLQYPLEVEHVAYSSGETINDDVCTVHVLASVFLPHILMSYAKFFILAMLFDEVFDRNKASLQQLVTIAKTT